MLYCFNNHRLVPFSSNGENRPVTPSSSSADESMVIRPPLTDVLLAVSTSEQTLFFPGHTSPGEPASLAPDTVATSAQWRELVIKAAPRVLITGWSTPPLEPGMLAPAGGPVEYVCHLTGSVRHVVTRDMISDGLKVSNWGQLIAPQVAEHALLLVLAALRDLPAWRERAFAPAGKSRLATRTLHGARVGIYGFGAVARQLLALLRPFSPEIAAYSAGVPASFIQEHGVIPAPSLEALCKNADVFIVCEALTSSTRLQLQENRLRLLPSGAVFVNIARGELIDETALAQIARSRGLRLGLDVFTHEPLPTDSPLADIPSALLSPHIAGPTDDFFPELGRHALKQIERHLSGLPPRHLLTLTQYDRST